MTDRRDTSGRTPPPSGRACSGASAGSAVAHEFVLVQSDLYLGADGGPGDLTRMVDEDWDAVMFNGYVNQYRDLPIPVEPGRRIRVWVPAETGLYPIVTHKFSDASKDALGLFQAGEVQMTGSAAH